MPLIGTRKFPKGPSLKHLEEHLFNLSGTRVKFLAPKHYHHSIPAAPANNGDFNLYEKELFKRFEEDDLSEPSTLWLKFRRWEFTGMPLLDGTGFLGGMTMGLTIQHMPEFESLFSPKKFECAIERYIYTSPDTYRDSGACRLDWKLVKFNNLLWVSYYSDHMRDKDGYACQSLWHIPITDQHMFTVCFNQTITKRRTRLPQIYQAIINQVMSSFEIQLSSDAQSQRDYIKTNYPDEQLSEALSPYEFEEVEILERLELINQVSAENNHDFSIPDDVFEAQVQGKDRDQKRKAKNIKEHILASHLRFKDKNEKPDLGFPGQ